MTGMAAYGAMRIRVIVTPRFFSPTELAPLGYYAPCSDAEIHPGCRYGLRAADKNSQAHTVTSIVSFLVSN